MLQRLKASLPVLKPEIQPPASSRGFFMRRYWNAWLEQAQITNDADAHTYSHGVFLYEPRADDDPDAPVQLAGW